MTTNGKKILIIEDELPMMELLTEACQGAEFEVIGASDGQQGFDLAIKEKPDLVLLDLTLPTLDGISIMNKLREDPWGKNVCIIILTNIDSTDKMAEAMENNKNASFFEYLVKSEIKVEDILVKIKEKLGVA